MNELSDQDKQSFIEAAKARLRKMQEMSAGVGETITSLGSILGAGAISKPYGVYKTLTSGKFGTQEGIKEGERAAKELEEKLTYIPKSEKGVEYLTGTAEALESVVPSWLPPVMPEAQILTQLGMAAPRGTMGQGAKQSGLEAVKVAAKPVEQAMTEGKGPLAAALAPVRPAFAVAPTPTPPAPVQSRVSPLGFYSPAEQAILNTPRNKPSPGSAWLNDIKKAENVTDNEIKQMGLDQFLKSKPTFTKREVQDYIYSNKFDIQEKLFGGEIDPKKLQDGMDLLEDHLYEVSSPTTDVKKAINAIRKKGIDDPSFEYYKEVVDKFLRKTGTRDLSVDYFLNKDQGFIGSPKYKDMPELQVPGGSNYREMLLTLPQKEIAEKSLRQFQNRMMDKYINSGIMWRREASPEEIAEHDRLKLAWQKESESANYRTTHWDEPNVLAHVRMNDRVDSNGKKVLFIEELQSDWGQQGQKKGFDVDRPKFEPTVQPGERDALISLMREEAQQKMISRGIPQDQAEYVTGSMGHDILADISGRGNEYRDLLARENADRMAEMKSLEPRIPSGPFVTNTNDWTELALKRVMKRAADEGYDRVAFVSGKQTDERYNLSKYVTEISAKPTASGRFDVKFTDRDGVSHTNLGMDEDALEATFGKTLASRIIDEDGGTYRDLDLQIKEKWPYQFYDKLVPNVASKLVKKMGGKELTTVSIPQTAEGWPQMELKQIGFDITPEMRKRLKSPIPYKKGGAVMAQKSKQPVKVSDNMYEIRQYMAK